ncbi:beta-1,3-endoglucanase [Stagonosporopsis vannaccii]|nr:beta-1,3-endoglucanase [Stagonosporopsis vannaccii]
MPSLSALLGVGAATLFSVASATKYAPADTYPGSSFFDHFNFVTVENNGGFVKYVDRNRAEDQNYIRYENGDAIFGVDSKSKLNSADGFDIGRESVRLEGKTEYNKGLFVLDLKHMPGGICGTWPAFWSLGREPWPVKGEIDIIEGVNQNSANSFVLHTDTKCKVNGLGQTGRQVLSDCAYDTSGPSGCNVLDTRTNSFGTGFNTNQGGHYVTEWQAEGIKIWFFPRGTAPKSLNTNEPDTSEFGTPAASFQGDCDIEKRFMDQRFIFTNNFCGEWAGNAYAASGCPMYAGMSEMASCKKYVAEHPELYKDAYWRVSSFKTYNKKTASSSSSSSSSVRPSTTSRVSSSSVRTSSSSVPSTSSSIQTSSSSVKSSSSSVQPSSSSVHVSSTLVSSSSSHVTSSSVHVSSSAVSSSSSHASSSSIHQPSSSDVHSSATPTPTPTLTSSSVHPSSTHADSSSTILSSSSSTYDVSSSIEHGSSSTVSVSASETPYEPVSSSSAAHASSSTVSSSASESPYEPVSTSSSTQEYSSGVSSSSATPHDTAPSSAFTPSASYSHDASSTIYTVSASETPYPHDSSSIPSSSSATDISGVYPSATPDASSSIPCSSGVSSSAYPDVTSSYPVDDKSSSSSIVYSTSVPIYSVYPEGEGYGHGSVSSKTPGASSTTSLYPISSSKTAEYNDYPVASSSVSVHENAYPTTTPVYPDYPELPSFTPLYSTYAAISSKTTTAYETTYVDVCPTGYTTITTKVTAIETPAPHPTTDAHYAPPGFEITTKYCAQGCGEGPKTVTVTVPCSKCQVPTPKPNKPADDKPYVPSQPDKPSAPVDSTTKITATKIITLTKIPVPESEYPATPSSAVPSVKHPASDADKGYGTDKPVVTTSKPVGGDEPVHPTPGNPVYPSAIGYPGSNVTLSYGTAASAHSKPSQTGYKAPEFTGAAGRMRVGGVVAGAAGLFAALMM